MEVVYAPAFLCILKKFEPHIKEGVKAAVAAVIDYYETGRRTPGLGLTQLRGDLWEARAGFTMAGALYCRRGPINLCAGRFS